MERVLSPESLVVETLKPFVDDPSIRAVAEGPECMYRTQDGRACAVGRCIPDYKYKPKFEGFDALGLDSLEGIDGVVRRRYRGHEPSLWVAIQATHDVNYHWTSTGLSEAGLGQLADLCGEHEINFERVCKRLGVTTPRSSDN